MSAQPPEGLIERALDEPILRRVVRYAVDKEQRKNLDSKGPKPLLCFEVSADCLLDLYLKELRSRRGETHALLDRETILECYPVPAGIDFSHDVTIAMLVALRSGKEILSLP